MVRTPIVLLASAAALFAQEIRHVNPEGLVKSPAYSHAVTAKPGTVVWVAGQVALNSKAEVVGRGDLKAQADQAWANVKTVLAASGAGVQDVVKITTYVVNYRPAMRDILREARMRAMGNAEPPAATLVGVQSLASEDYLVEIEVTAVVR